MKPLIRSRRWRLAIQIVIVALLFAALIYFGGKDFLVALTNFDHRFLALAFAAYFLSLILTFYRWYLLVRALDLPFRVYDAIRLGFVGAIMSLFMPGSVSGDLVKAGFIATEQKRRAAAVATIVVDRIIGLYSLLVLTSLLGIFYWNEVLNYTGVSQIIIFVWAITGGAGVAVMLTIPFRAPPLIARLQKVPFIGRALAELVRALQSYKHKPWVVLKALLIGMVGHVGFVMCFHLAACGSPLPTPTWQVHFLIIPVYMVGGAVPMTPMANLGVGEWMLGGLYEMVGADLKIGASVALAQRVISWLSALIGLIWYIPLKRAAKLHLPAHPEDQQTPAELEAADGRVPPLAPTSAATLASDAAPCPDESVA